MAQERRKGEDWNLGLTQKKGAMFMHNLKVCKGNAAFSGKKGLCVQVFLPCFL